MEPVIIYSNDDNFMELQFHNNNRHKQVKLTDLETNKVVFNKTCDTLITGDFIYHLRKGIKRFKENKKPIKMVLSKWFTKLDCQFLTHINYYPHISTIFENKKGEYIVIFKVYLSEKKYYIFETTLDKIEKFVGKR